jgi:hypothetical protein
MFIADSTWTTSASGTPWARWFLLRDPHLHAAHLEGFTFSLLEKAAMIPIRRCVLGGLGKSQTGCTVTAGPVPWKGLAQV